ncbi:TadE/TadG family type IV pilus assembly protein [Albidovulum sp.]|uniref:TadE/TadG family type IV pilus assembly protein n=1 Tax=Albidovulum sp. TaxID=1872424 RepID=UPI0039B936B1
MSGLLHILRRFWRDETGTALVELAFAIPLFLLLFFGLIDFGRMGAEYVMADKAMQIATRIAVVRPPACPGVPATNLRGTVPAGTVPPRFGTACSAGATICATASAAPCTGVAGNPTVNEIWTAIAPLMPAGSSVANLSFRYDFDPNLNFLGGPYVPVVTVELTNLNFSFVTPLGGLAAVATQGPVSGLSGSLPFPAMSMSLPGEDLNLGENG